MNSTKPRLTESDSWPGVDANAETIPVTSSGTPALTEETSSIWLSDSKDVKTADPWLILHEAAASKSPGLSMEQEYSPRSTPVKSGVIPEKSHCARWLRRSDLGYLQPLAERPSGRANRTVSQHYRRLLATSLQTGLGRARRLCGTLSVIRRRDPRPRDAAATTDLIIVGDAGLNLGTGHQHNVGQLFNLAAETLASSLSQSDQVITIRASGVTSFNTALTQNGMITGSVTYFGHGGVADDGTNKYYALEVGEGTDTNTNITVQNVSTLSNANLGPNVAITLNACNAGKGGRGSIANQLQRTVLAYPVDLYFSSTPNSAPFVKGMSAPTGIPTYMIPNGNGVKPTHFRPN